MMLVLPLLIPLFSIIVLIPLLGFTKFQKWFSLAAVGVLTAVSVLLLINVHNNGVAVLQLGSWKAPFGITLAADMLAAILLTATSCTALAAMIYSIGFIDEKRVKAGYYPLVFGMLMGVDGAFLTGDLFNLYVWYEVMLTSSFVLMVLGATSEQLKGGVKYLAMNFVASIFFVSAIGILYGMIGSLNMADIAVRIRESEGALTLNGVFMLFLIAFSIKAALFPFFFWLPASYHTPPIVITALFSGTLTKVAIYTLFRFYGLFISRDPSFWEPFFLLIAGITMTVGVLMAASQNDIRKILSFHIISQIGYMVMGLAIFTVGSLAGAIFFTVHNILAKSCLFLSGGLVKQRSGSFELGRLGGLYRKSPYLGILFFIPAISLIGIPPTSGFFGKFFLIQSGIVTGHYIISAFAVLVGLLTMFSMIKIWNEAFWKEEPEEHQPAGKMDPAAIAATSLLMALVVLMGVFAGPISALCLEAGRQIVQPEAYINAVLFNH
jgi:multicomponent Na+:H+ antiporter subunit D